MMHVMSTSSNAHMGESMSETSSQTHHAAEQEINDNNLQRAGEQCPKCLNLLLDNGGHRIPEIVKLAEESGVVLESVELRKPTLDDVFLSVTGRNIRDEEGSFVDMVRRHRILRARGQPNKR
jgi:hypothetical protein